MAINLQIDGRPVQAEAGMTILDAARAAGIKIPTLCHLPGRPPLGACRVCVVEVKGARTLVASCAAPVAEGMEVYTNTPTVRQARREIVSLLLSNHPQECLTCIRNGNCELQQLAEELGVRGITYPGERSDYPLDESNPAIVRDPRKCILCRRCERVCREVQGVSAISAAERGFDTVITPAFGRGLGEVACALCGQCVLACPTAALAEKEQTEVVWRALADPEKFTVVQVAPAIRATIGEEFGLPPGTLVTGKLVAALRRLGFKRVFDTDFAADLTIMEEGNELLERLAQGGPFPLITSCSPGWVKFCEHFFPELLPNLSSCKSPQEMFGAVMKSWGAQREGVDPKHVFVVSVMPCTAKKFEIERPEMTTSGGKDVDAVLTTRELARMLRQAGIDLTAMPEEEFDNPLGVSTGAGVIFGTTGGVMEAALRTVYEKVTGQELPGLEFTPIRGLEGIKEAEVKLPDGRVIRLAVAHGLGNARRLLERIRSGEGQYEFVEIMACPGGCIGGGGGPIPTDDAIRQARAAAIYNEDRRLPLRKSHENPAVKTLYEEFLGAPGSEKAHHLLHTHYQVRSRH